MSVCVCVSVCVAHGQQGVCVCMSSKERKWLTITKITLDNLL